jgi:murein DD-endopeptidase MepM/ murein hydrolase activator NlpD
VATLVAISASSLLGCHADRAAPLHPQRPPGRWHVVAAGETLASIARDAGIPAEDILEINGLLRAEEVVPGKTIFVLEPSPPPTQEQPVALPASSSQRAGLLWPLTTVRIVVGSPFGTRDGRAHEGIDLPAPLGTPVFAAAEGRVAYAGNGIRGYGNMIVLRHDGDLMTVYAHNSVLLVSQGQPVRAGDRIALVGQSGRATGPHLHFEVRSRQIPTDPMRFLPPRAE